MTRWFKFSPARLLAVLGVLIVGVTWAWAQSGQGNYPGGQTAPPVQGSVVPLGTVNKSLTITSGNTFQTVLPALTTVTPRNSLTIQNNNINTDNCWVYPMAGTATTPTAILLAPGASYGRYWPFVPSGPIQVTCATTGDALYVDYQ